MCKHKTYQIDHRAMATEGAYDGQTVRLDRRTEQTIRRHNGFRWWMLWMIWPLVALAKWFVPLYVGAATAILAQLSAAGAAPFIAVALIVVGLLLIRRR